MLTSPPLLSEDHTSPASQPVDVPSMGGARSNHLEADDTSFDTYQLPPNSFSRPPRLPLPIEEEFHNPGSPIVSPHHLDDDDELPRRSSVVSSTVDDDEEPDNFEGYSTEHAGPKVPTIIEWRPAKHNDRVYVTGTFTNWERKFRLYRDGPSKHKDALSATLQLPPGTHHIKFIANGDMVTSEALPTTVDYTNILVNYIEVSLDQVKNQDKSSRSGTTTPTPVPAGPPAPSRPLDIRPKPVDPDSQPIPNFTAPQDPPHKTLPPKNYTSSIPQYLLDLDTYIPSGKEHDTSPAAQAARYRIERANAAADSQPAPPSLPMFLSKSILNGTTPMKDDSSVLIMPNHTVLNHLATTNIKQGVLATSATTRYKRKFLTTIMYKPRSDEGD
ncbi:5'-AMP-activated protein kinase beta subunit, interation domain-containing protein [Delphinella strobiligena]|nr:5'-AMP-activated protein kinase beta subunit, interation domain-containing protein [Delphinella strobiligena]